MTATMGATLLRFRPSRPLRYAVAAAILAVGVASVAHAATSGGDFRLAIWFPGQALLHGRDPYDIASFEHYYGSRQVEAYSLGWFPLYGPVHLWLALFFALFPVKVAAGLWFAVNLAGLAVIATVVVRALDGRLGGPAVMAMIGLLALTRPGRALLESGQATVVYVLLTYVVWSQARRRPLVAAVALALALGKPPFGLPLLALVLARRLWPVALRGVAIFVAASAPIVLWLSLNAGSPGTLWHSVVHNLSYTDHNRLDAPGSPGRIDALSLIARYVHGHFGGGAEVAAFVVLVGVVAAVVGRAAGGPGWSLEPAVVLMLGLVTVLAVAHEYYDLLLLAWPFAAVMRWPVERVITASRFAHDRGPDDAAVRDDRLPGAPPVASSDSSDRWAAVLALTTLPALVVSVIPAQATTKLLGLGSGTAIISTLTTACLLVALVGALVVVSLDHRRMASPIGGSNPRTVGDPRPTT
ncbi:MAG TPA: glycosyltransferase 87 family protein [Acidimicrobiales bacterium]|nr:glycosyltransferase 87 family protein [Acidimicrobiales bacterium]